MIGNTPLVLIDCDKKIYAKLETHNKTGSVKDRMIKHICDHSVKSGEIVPGKTIIVEATSGNTGIALASYASSIFCKCIIIMPRNMSEQRKVMMRSLGAEIIETGDNEFAEAISLRDNMVFKKNSNTFKELYFSPMQFKNPLNVACHEKITAPEIFADLKRETDLAWSAFVHGSGTGGTMMGVKNFIDKNNLDVTCVLTQPMEDNSSHGIQGINDGADFLLNRSKMDLVISIKTDDAMKRMKRFWRETGLLVGISSGANILAAESYYEVKKPKGAIVTILCDRGERYM